MTLHKCKGLEFTIVFIVGVEKGILPGEMWNKNINETKFKELQRKEEERRLFYVGITRAMKFLYIVYANSRYFKDKSKTQNKSIFISDLP